jgi:putative membrane protein
MKVAGCPLDSMSPRRTSRLDAEMRMLTEVIAAYAHFLAIFTTLALLVAEAALYRQHMGRATLRLLRRLDLFYLFGAIAIIVTGLLRVFFFAKGWEFYAANPIFWVKMLLFLAVGLLSVPPTIHYIKSERTLAGDGLAIADATYRRMRGFITAQLVLFACIPLAATLMARGIGA